MPDAESPRALHLIANRFDVVATLPYEIIPGYQLRRGTPEEVERFRAELARYCKWFDPVQRFETNIRTEDEGNGRRTHYHDPLPADESYYWVIVETRPVTDNPFYDGVSGIERASHLLDHEIEAPFALYVPNGFGTNTYYRRRFDEHDWIRNEARTAIDNAYLADLRDTVTRMQAIATNQPDIKRSVDMLFELRNVDRRFELYLLGLFAVLESLLTHDPKGAFDSLSHQIHTKITLLGKRFDRPLDYSRFNGAKESSIWKKLYECRSRIAHGGELSFDKELKSLGNYAVVVETVSTAIKAVLRLALREPELILDLREC